MITVRSNESSEATASAIVAVIELIRIDNEEETVYRATFAESRWPACLNNERVSEDEDEDAIPLSITGRLTQSEARLVTCTLL